MKQLHVYMLRCSDQTIYVGVTNNIARRFNEHQTGINETA
jgi:putative endonuclease